MKACVWVLRDEGKRLLRGRGNNGVIGDMLIQARRTDEITYHQAAVLYSLFDTPEKPARQILIAPLYEPVVVAMNHTTMLLRGFQGTRSGNAWVQEWEVSFEPSRA